MTHNTILKAALALTLMAGVATGATAQQTSISPTPQRIAWGQKAFDRPSAIDIKGIDKADRDAVDALLSQFAKGKGVKVTIGQRGDKAVRAVADSIPGQPQGYFLRVRPGEVIIAGNDPTGTYYGVQTFLQVASQPEVMSVDISDWPSTPSRGVVEGFYGNAWSFDDRIDQFAFYGRNKLDTYIYGPKDDPYHRAKWRELYPAEEAARMKALNDEAVATKCASCGAYILPATISGTTPTTKPRCASSSRCTASASATSRYSSTMCSANRPTASSTHSIWTT